MDPLIRPLHRCGNHKASRNIILPRPFLEQLGLTEDRQVAIALLEDCIVIRKAPEAPQPWSPLPLGKPNSV